MTDKKKVNIDPSKETVIGFEGAEMHHDLKNSPGKNGDQNHAESDDGKEETDK